MIKNIIYFLAHIFCEMNWLVSHKHLKWNTRGLLWGSRIKARQRILVRQLMKKCCHFIELIYQCNYILANPKYNSIVTIYFKTSLSQWLSNFIEDAASCRSINYISIRIWIRINLYLGFKDSMKLIDDKGVKSKLSLFYNLIGISNKICICYNMKV